MAHDLAALFTNPSLDTLSEGHANLILCARMWVTLRKRGNDPTPLMAQRLGSDGAAWQFWLLMEEVGTAWPEPFIVSPPCCRVMSFDEGLLMNMIDSAMQRDSTGFHRLLSEMLPMDHCERLYRTTGAFLASLAEAAAES